MDPRDHYQFGENWSRFAQGVTERHVDEAVVGLAKLVGPDLRGKTFLDIGCGSGLHSLAALRLGAAAVTAFDIDPQSVATTRSLLARFAPEARVQLEVRSVVDALADASRHDVVYSWGVLHHTGRLWHAIDRAASLVAPGGRLAIAIYRRTPLCRLWRAEKRFYALGPRWYRPVADQALAALMVAALLVTGRNPIAYIRDYPRLRGMTFMTNIRDWLGGYPYESAAPAEIREFLRRRSFIEEKFFPCNTRIGLLGVGCDEYVFRAQGTNAVGAG